jgi:hypothetical protein
MEKARELRVVQLNPTMGSAAVGQSVKALADYAVSAARGKTVVLVAVVRWEILLFFADAQIVIDG